MIEQEKEQEEQFQGPTSLTEAITKHEQPFVHYRTGVEVKEIAGSTAIMYGKEGMARLVNKSDDLEFLNPQFFQPYIAKLGVQVQQGERHFSNFKWRQHATPRVSAPTYLSSLDVMLEKGSVVSTAKTSEEMPGRGYHEVAIYSKTRTGIEEIAGKIDADMKRHQKLTQELRDFQ
jgi:hypothetical protein